MLSSRSSSYLGIILRVQSPGRPGQTQARPVTSDQLEFMRVLKELFAYAIKLIHITVEIFSVSGQRVDLSFRTAGDVSFKLAYMHSIFAIR